MKNKIIKICSLLVLVAMILPSFSLAIIVPSVNITINVITQGQEQTFNFTVKTGYTNNWQDYHQFDLPTANLTGSQTISPTISDYLVTQNVVPGLNLKTVNCISDLAPNSGYNDIFIPQANGIIIHPGENNASIYLQ